MAFETHENFSTIFPSSYSSTQQSIDPNQSYSFDYEKNFGTCNCSLSSYPHSGITLYDYFPSLKILYPFQIENNFRSGCMALWSRCNYWICPTMVIIYLISIYVGSKIMMNRKPLDLRAVFKYWNLALFIFSFMGMIRVVPHLLLIIYVYGFKSTICHPATILYGNNSVGLWTFLFIYSKYIELVDTLFIILRKKPLLFIHYFHHASVLLYTWDAFTVEQPAGIYFVSMNYTIHTVMYLYYFLTLHYNKRYKWNYIVTLSQILQMFLGVTVTMYSLYYASIYPLQYKWNVHYNRAEGLYQYQKNHIVVNVTSNDSIPSQDGNYGNLINKFNLFAACAMYATYFFLFVKFFFEKYIIPQIQVQKKLVHKD